MSYVSCLSHAWVVALFAGQAALAFPPQVRVDLSGRVLSATGEPLPGAKVFIYTAAPKRGPGIL